MHNLAFDVAHMLAGSLVLLSFLQLYQDRLYAPIAGGVASASERLNRLQFLTIRQYLSLVFAAVILLLLVLAIWP